ncbi:MAG: non-canonical purine NTP pyrophosphatase, RdgB/HAM1 family [Dehalococcoidia bacterium]|nr:non-canonical purine NTP pyrophosphatase, RdgB/HAM1 family [Dehalococcoidia bacterium]MQG15429.1 RdgB/HAM1 family non-canonical purine NTP pyrophosphatase [SAR202 cluster bacterium]
MELLIATHNQGKYREFADALRPMGVSVLSLKTLGIHREVEETGTTFQENAILKATEYYSHSNIPTLSDDSGLIVDVLNGAPGIKSARYAGNNATDQENRDKLLYKLADTPANKRRAMFVCVIAIITKPNEIKLFQGKIQGRIANKETGKMGFGYDSIFIPENDTRSMAQLTDHEKIKISHRGIALRKTSNWFKNSRILN